MLLQFNKRSFFLATFTVLMIFLLAACSNDSGNQTNPVNTDNESNQVEHVTPVETDAVPKATLTMENGGKVVIELYPNIATNTVNNFIQLANDHFYDGLIFHRVIPGFMVQGGDPNGNGTGGPDYSIMGEFSNNGFENNLKHERGVLSMARSQHPDSAGSQFFIMTDDSENLDGEYAAFGKVIEGMDVVDEIVQAQRDGKDKPLEDQVIQSITIDLDGYKAEKPQTIK